MPRYAVIAIGFGLGVFIAGVVNAAVVSLLPEGLRGVAIVWGTTVVVTVATTAASWMLMASRRSRRP